jgi:hypothetical protein
MNKALIAMLTVLGASLAHAQTAPNGVTPDTPPNVLDAAGRPVGTLFHFQYNYGPLITRGNVRFVVPLQRTTTNGDPTDIHASSSASQFLYRSLDSLLYYTSTDCSGDPIVTGTEGPTPAMVLREGSTVTAYVSSNAASQSFTVASQRSTDTGVCTTEATPTQRTGWPTTSKIELSRDYPEPLTVSY